MRELKMAQEAATAAAAEAPSSHSEFLKELRGRRYDDKDISDEKLIKFRYIEENLKLKTEDIDQLRRRASDNLLRDKKLVLILDLDHTLIHSAYLSALTTEEGHLPSQAMLAAHDPNRYLSLLLTHMIVKLRPFVRTFLKEASTMFEMYIYTCGTRNYALDVVKILDPEGTYFDTKVIARQDSSNETVKDFDVVLADEKMIVVLDDNNDVWTKSENQISMLEYHYFSSPSDDQSVKSFSEHKEDESIGVLVNILQVLKRAHEMFFDPDHLDTDLADRDVRLVLEKIREETLLGCKLLFSPESLYGSSGIDGRMVWMMALELGATCCTDEDPSVTHVVSWNHDLEKAQWAMENKKFFVEPGWIRAAFYLWHKQPEEMYEPLGETQQTALLELLNLI